MKLFGRQLGAFDIGRICSYVVSTGALMTTDNLHTLGLHASAATHIANIAGRCTFGATLVAEVINKAAPAGSRWAIIPRGTAPAVVPAPGVDAPTVAHLESSSMTPYQIGPASSRPSGRLCDPADPTPHL